MGFDSSVNFFINRVNQRNEQIIPTHGSPNLAKLEYSAKFTPYYNFNYHEKALVRPLYHAINLVRDLVTLIGGIALTLASLYYDRAKTKELTTLSVVQLSVVLGDCLLALTSIFTFISRTYLSLKVGYTENHHQQDEYSHDDGYAVISDDFNPDEAIDRLTVNYEHRM